MSASSLVLVALLLLQAAPPRSQPPAGGTPPAPPSVPAAAAPAALPAAREQALRTQVMLDRAGFSPGAIDGRMGGNTTRALEAYTRQGGAPGVLDDALTSYTLTDADLSVPFTPQIPDDLMAQSKLPALQYRDAAELIAERFHTTPEFLRELNPGATFAAGESVRVPDVEPLVLPATTDEEGADASRGGSSPARAGQRDSAPGRGQTAGAAPAKPDVVITVRKATASLTVADASGRTVFYAPVTTGSEYDPLPIGEWKVNGVQRNPTFHYNPDLFWDAEPSHARATIPAGPNNPVGLVWIDITREHYGLHGTPAPEAVGHAASHGCVRLTNWDAVRLAELVKPGTRVLFVE